MRYEIRKVDLWSAIKVAFLISTFYGILFGFFYVFVLQIVKSYFFTHGDFHTLKSISFFTGIMGIFLALMFAFAVAMIGTLTLGMLVWIFNQAAGSSGGLILDLERHVPDRLVDIELEGASPPSPVPTSLPPPDEDEEPVA